MLTCAELECERMETLMALLGRYGLRVARVPSQGEIPGSYWGDSEAGLVGDGLFVRDDTPVHSACTKLVTTSAWDAGRRARLHTDAGGDRIEKNGFAICKSCWRMSCLGLGGCECSSTWMPGVILSAWVGPRLVRTGRRGCSPVGCGKTV